MYCPKEIEGFKLVVCKWVGPDYTLQTKYTRNIYKQNIHTIPYYTNNDTIG